MYEAKYIIVFNFSGEKSLWKIVRGLMPGSQWHQDNHNQSTSRKVQWIAGSIDLGNNSSSVPSTPSFPCTSQSCVVYDCKF